jgi:hypothetical protein
MAGAIWMDSGLNLYSQYGAAFANTSFKFGLYNNNHTPVVTDVIGAYTQLSNGGYSKQGTMGFPYGSSVAGVVMANVYTASWTFTANAFAESIYGWTFEVDPSGGGLVLACAKLLTTPILIPPTGMPFSLTFTFSLQRKP